MRIDELEVDNLFHVVELHLIQSEKSGMVSSLIWPRMETTLGTGINNSFGEVLFKPGRLGMRVDLALPGFIAFAPEMAFV